MGMKTVAIIGALDEEVALIAKSLTHVTHTAKGSLDIVSGTVDSFGSDVIKVAATVGGMGLVNAAATTQLLIDEIAPDAVIFSGIAGNLNTHLHINDVVLGGTLPTSPASSPPATTSWTRPKRSRRSSDSPGLTPWRWKAPPWHRSPPAITCRHW